MPPPEVLRFVLSEITGPSPRCEGPAWGFRIQLAAGMNPNWPALGTAIRESLPAIEREGALPDLLAGVADAGDAIIELAGALMRPQGIQELEASFETASQAVRIRWVGSLQQELCGQALALAERILRLALEGAAGRAGEANTLNVLRFQLQSFLRRTAGARRTVLTQQLLECVQRRGMPTLLLEPRDGVYSLGACGAGRLVQITSNDHDCHFGVMLCNRKDRTNTVLRRLGLPVPRQCIATEEAHLAGAIREVHYPCVVKPANAERGEGVTVGVSSEEELRAAFAVAKKHRQEVLIEQQLSGADHRLTVINGQVRFAIRRDPPTITGNGHDTAEGLIREENRIRRERHRTDGVSGQIEVDEEVRTMLERAGFQLEAAIPEGLTIPLRRNANVSTGGTMTDVSDRVHEEVKRMCATIARTFRMAVVGIDYLCNDISLGGSERRGGFIEVNSMPQMNASRAEALVEALFPGREGKHNPEVVLLDARRVGDCRKVPSLRRALQGRGVVAVAQGSAAHRALLSESAELPMRAYHHPNEILLDASIDRCTFVIDLREFERRGLPFRQPGQLSLLVAPDVESHPATRIFLANLRSTPVQKF